MLKFYQIFYFFNIDEVPKFRPQLKILADTVITSASGAQAMRDEILVSKSAQAADIATRPQVVPMAGVNIAFSKVGMEKVSLRVYFSIAMRKIRAKSNPSYSWGKKG